MGIYSSKPFFFITISPGRLPINGTLKSNNRKAPIKVKNNPITIKKIATSLNILSTLLCKYVYFSDSGGGVKEIFFIPAFIALFKALITLANAV